MNQLNIENPFESKLGILGLTELTVVLLGLETDMLQLTSIETFIYHTMKYTLHNKSYFREILLKFGTFNEINFKLFIDKIVNKITKTFTKILS